MSPRILLLPILSFLLFTSSGQEKNGAAKAIARANAEFEKAHVHGDAKAIAQQYTEDAQLLWEDREIIKGRAAIEAEWRKDIGGPGRKATITLLEIEEHGDWAFETSKFVVTAPEGKIVYDGKYICIWKRVNGDWKIHRDIGNKNSPAKE